MHLWSQGDDNIGSTSITERNMALGGASTLSTAHCLLHRTWSAAWHSGCNIVHCPAHCIAHCIARGLLQATARSVSLRCPKPWDFDTSSVFAHIDAFLQRCNDLLEVCGVQGIGGGMMVQRANGAHRGMGRIGCGGAGSAWSWGVREPMKAGCCL